MQLMTKPCGSIRYQIWGRDGWRREKYGTENLIDLNSSNNHFS